MHCAFQSKAQPFSFTHVPTILQKFKLEVLINGMLSTKGKLALKNKTKTFSKIAI